MAERISRWTKFENKRPTIIQFFQIDFFSANLFNLFAIKREQQIKVE